MNGDRDEDRARVRDPWPKNPAGFVLGVAQFFDRWGLFTQWYWPPGSRGKLWNFFHGKGWRET